MSTKNGEAMKKMLKWMGLAAAMMSGVAYGGPKVSVTPPVMSVAKTTAPIVIDGKLNDEEWARASSLTALSGNPVGNPFLLPSAQQTTFLVTYDDTHLYIGMRSPHPKGTYPSGRVKDHDNSQSIFEDHIELQFTPHGRKGALTPFKGFFKVVSNAWDAVHDSHYFNGTPDSEDLWSMDGQVKSEVTDEYWNMEMSISIEALQCEGGLNGRELISQLVRTGSALEMYFAGWVCAAWTKFDTFGTLKFADDATVVKHLGLGDIKKGNLDAKFIVDAPLNRDERIRAELLVKNPQGKVLYKDQQNQVIKAGQRSAFEFKASGLDVSEMELEQYDRNRCHVIFKNGEGKIVYEHDVAFMKQTEEWDKKFLQPWLERKAGQESWDLSYAYHPYPEMFQMNLDLNFFGVEKSVREAKTYRMKVQSNHFKANKRRTVMSCKGEIVDFKASVEKPLVSLAEGTYRVSVELFDAQGQLLDTKEELFHRKHYPFEKNDIGISKEVIPPYDPIMPVMKKDEPLHAAKVVKRLYRFESTGLPKQITAEAPTGTVGGPQNLLSAPISLQAFQEGTVSAWESVKTEEFYVRDHEAKTVATLQSDRVTARLTSTLDYDGWLETELELDSVKGKSIDSLVLEIPLRQVVGSSSSSAHLVDTIFAQKFGMLGKSNHYGDLSQDEGVVFKSSDLNPSSNRSGPADVAKDWKSFLPILFLGNGDRGLWFYAWSDRGWKLSDEQSMLEVVRQKNGDVTLKVHLVSGSTVFKDHPSLKFAIQATPIKPNDPYYRNGAERLLHDTSGFRYYGKSVDGYVLDEDREFEELRKYLLYGTRNQEKSNRRYMGWYGRLGKKLVKGEVDKISLYGSQWMTGLGADEFKTYGGEWMGKSNWKPLPEMQFTGLTNVGKTVTWTSPEALTAQRVNWSPSMVDFFLYHHERLIEKAGINGTWWDNCYGGMVTAYDPVLKRFDSHWNLRMRRELTKRLNIMGWKHMRRPNWLMNTQVEMAWVQNLWLIEGPWSIPTSYTAFDEFDLGWFRSKIRPKSTVMVVKQNIKRSAVDKAEKARMDDSLEAYYLLHDMPVKDRSHRRGLVYWVDYERSESCKFSGYWNMGHWAKNLPEGVKVSVYQNASMDQAVLVFANFSKEDVDLSGVQCRAAAMLSNVKGGGKAMENYDSFEAEEVLNRKAVKLVEHDSEWMSFGSSLKLPSHRHVMIGIKGWKQQK